MPASDLTLPYIGLYSMPSRSTRGESADVLACGTRPASAAVARNHGTGGPRKPSVGIMTRRSRRAGRRMEAGGKPRPSISRKLRPLGPKTPCWSAARCPPPAREDRSRLRRSGAPAPRLIQARLTNVRTRKKKKRGRGNDGAWNLLFENRDGWSAGENFDLAVVAGFYLEILLE